MRLLTLLSGGIDSPVASHLMSKRGHDVDMVHFDNRPYSDEANLEKVLALAGHMRKINEDQNEPALHIVPQKEALGEIRRLSPSRYFCILCRRMMLRAGSRIAEGEGYDALVTGESLGQVASQTLPNIWVEEPAATVPVLRPLIGLDKVEIIDMARDMGSYEISIQTSKQCTMSPSDPATGASLDDILEIEAKMDLEDLVSSMLDGKELHTGP